MPNEPVKFLLVDDQEGNLLALAGLLKRDGLELHSARSAADALELLLQHDFSLAFLDVQMPGTDGFELAELMRGTERTRRVPIIFVTAGAVDKQRRFRGYEAGAVDFLFKPIEPHILKSKAEVFFDLARQKNELRHAAEDNARLLAESRATAQALRHAQDELQRHAVDLEKIVDERTAELRESIGQLEHFSYTITHDMRAPLRAMQAFGQILVDEHAGLLDETGRDYLRRIVRAASRMDHLIVDTLNYSKVIQDKLIMGPIDPGPLLRGIVESYPQFQSPSAEIKIADHFPKVWANQAGLTQCFSNFLSNAVKFVLPQRTPHVRVWGEDHGETVRLWFEDNGIGIPADQRGRIFGMFQRLNRNYEGTGVGLALVQKMVERMNGRLGVESTEGKGSRFWIELTKAEGDSQFAKHE